MIRLPVLEVTRLCKAAASVEAREAAWAVHGALRNRARSGASSDGVVVSLNIAAHGALHYAVAVAKGDRCDEATYQHRLDTCAVCPNRHEDAEGVAWCGPPLEDRTAVEPVEDRTCGCVLVTACAVASKPCPAGRFGAV